MPNKLARFVRTLPDIKSLGAVAAAENHEREAKVRADIATIDTELAELDRREAAAEIGIRSLAGFPLHEEASDDGFSNIFEGEDKS